MTHAEVQLRFFLILKNKEVIMDLLLRNQMEICEESVNILTQELIKQYCDSDKSEIPKSVSMVSTQ